MIPRLLRKISPKKRDALARPRQGSEHREVPEQDLEQERQVADQLDIAAGEPGNQPIGRQPRNADDEAEHGRQHDPDPGDQQRVEQADQEDAAIGVGFAIGNERLIDVESGRGVEKAEAAGDPFCVEIGLGVEREFVAEPEHHCEQEQLVENGPDLRVVVKGDPRRCRGAFDFDHAQYRAYRTGGAYWMPPLVHSRLMPRLMPSLEPVPTLRSNTSP